MKKFLSLLFITIFLYSCSFVPPSDPLSNNNELGGIIECPVHSIDYHSFDDVFIQYVGDEVFYEWIRSQEENESDDDCLFGYGFPDFIKHFGITEETYYRLFEDTISSYMYDHPAELLFHGTEEEIETYYRDLEANKVRIEEKLCVLELKQALVDKAVRKIDNIRTAKVAELYNASSLSEDELLAIIQNINRTKLYVNISPEKTIEAKSESDIFVEAPNTNSSVDNIIRGASEVIEWGEPDVEVVIEPVGEE